MGRWRRIREGRTEGIEKDSDTWYILREQQGATFGYNVYNTERRERWESRLRPRGLEGHGEETVFNVMGNGLKALDPIITLVDLYKHTMSTIGDTF